MFMLAGARIKPVAVIAGLVIMIAALVYIALNRAHSAPPEAPLHQPAR
jgi:hypothetical protein